MNRMCGNEMAMPGANYLCWLQWIPWTFNRLLPFDGGHNWLVAE